MAFAGQLYVLVYCFDALDKIVSKTVSVCSFHAKDSFRSFKHVFIMLHFHSGEGILI